MKVAITTNTTDAGGAEKQRILLANALAVRGHDVLLVVLQREGALQRLISPEVRTKVIAFHRRLPSAFDILLTGTTNTELTFGVLNRTRGRAGGWLAAVHNPVSAKAPRLRRLSRILVRRADARIALTPQHQSSLAKHWRLTAEYVVPNASAQTSTKVRSPRAIEPSGKLGYLGRLAIEHKGLDRLIHGMAETAADRLSLEIAGSGPDEEKLRKLIRDARLESQITLTGFVEAGQFLERIDGLVLLSRWEAQPMVLLEAALAGLPVVVSKEIDADTGVDADDPREVAAALVKLGTGRVEPQAASLRDPDMMSADYLAVFETVRRKA